MPVPYDQTIGGIHKTFIGASSVQFFRLEQAVRWIGLSVLNEVIILIDTASIWGLLSVTRNLFAKSSAITISRSVKALLEVTSLFTSTSDVTRPTVTITY